MPLARYTQSNNALGGLVEINLVSGANSDQIESTFRRLWVEIWSFERRFSRFLPSSELTRFNRDAGLKTSVSKEFKSVINAVIYQSNRTSGLFNPFILPVLQRAGYIKSALDGYGSDRQKKYLDRRVVAIDKIVTGKNWVQIPYGTALDFGGIGKGYLADKLAEIICSKGLSGFSVSISGDIFAAGVDENGHPIRIGLQSANNPNDKLDLAIDVNESGYGVATSGTFKRAGQIGDWHHIIDPNTLKPAITNIVLATVVCNNAVDADILASTAIILGENKAMKFLKDYGVKAAVIQYVDGDHKIKVKSFGRLISHAEPAESEVYRV